MALQINKVHHYVKQPGENAVKLVNTNPYMRFSREGGGTVFLQGGHFYYEGGDLCPDRPAWLEEELDKASPFALKECGYVLSKQEVSKIRTAPEPNEPRQTTTRRAPVVRRTGNGGSNRE